MARNDSLAMAVAAAPDAAETLVDLMQMFRDKADVFCLASELLCRIVQADKVTMVSFNEVINGDGDDVVNIRTSAPLLMLRNDLSPSLGFWRGRRS